MNTKTVFVQNYLVDLIPNLSVEAAADSDVGTLHPGRNSIRGWLQYYGQTKNPFDGPSKQFELSCCWNVLHK